MRPRSFLFLTTRSCPALILIQTAKKYDWTISDRDTNVSMLKGLNVTFLFNLETGTFYIVGDNKIEFKYTDLQQIMPLLQSYTPKSCGKEDFHFMAGKECSVECLLRFAKGWGWTLSSCDIDSPELKKKSLIFRFDVKKREFCITQPSTAKLEYATSIDSILPLLKAGACEIGNDTFFFENKNRDAIRAVESIARQFGWVCIFGVYTGVPSLKFEPKERLFSSENVKDKEGRVFHSIDEILPFLAAQERAKCHDFFISRDGSVDVKGEDVHILSSDFEEIIQRRAEFLKETSL